MNAKFQQYRFARIEGRNITRALLETQFKNGITDIDEFENAIVQQLAASSTGCAPWRKSEIEQEGCREGAQMAALEFYWVHRREVRNVVLKELRPAECDQTNVQ
jgi:hypothetical protein